MTDDFDIEAMLEAPYKKEVKLDINNITNINTICNLFSNSTLKTLIQCKL